MTREYISPQNMAAFWKRVQTSDDCWLWLGGRDQNGYGTFNVKDEQGIFKSVRAHRYAYELIIGSIPEGKILDHIECDNPPCVNPGHTEPSTHRLNILRGTCPCAIHARQTKCKLGHPYDAVNTLWSARSNGSIRRTCRICNHKWQAQYRARKRK